MAKQVAFTEKNILHKEENSGWQICYLYCSKIRLFKTTGKLLFKKYKSECFKQSKISIRGSLRNDVRKKLWRKKLVNTSEKSEKNSLMVRTQIKTLAKAD